MTTTTTAETITEWAGIINSTDALAQVLGLGPCEALYSAFPAIVGDDDTMGALAAMLDPMVAALTPMVMGGVMSADDAEALTHNVYHLLQIAAGLGHMLGVADAIGTPDVPADLSAVDWSDLPDTFGEGDEEEA